MEKEAWIVLIAIAFTIGLLLGIGLVIYFRACVQCSCELQTIGNMSVCISG